MHLRISIHVLLFIYTIQFPSSSLWVGSSTTTDGKWVYRHDTRFRRAKRTKYAKAKSKKKEFPTTNETSPSLSPILSYSPTGIEVMERNATIYDDYYNSYYESKQKSKKDGKTASSKKSAKDQMGSMAPSATLSPAVVQVNFSAPTLTFAPTCRQLKKKKEGKYAKVGKGKRYTGIPKKGSKSEPLDEFEYFCEDQGLENITMSPSPSILNISSSIPTKLNLTTSFPSILNKSSVMPTFINETSSQPTNSSEDSNNTESLKRVNNLELMPFKAARDIVKRSSSGVLLTSSSLPEITTISHQTPKAPSLSPVVSKEIKIPKKKYVTKAQSALKYNGNAAVALPEDATALLEKNSKVYFHRKGHLEPNKKKGKFKLKNELRVPLPKDVALKVEKANETDHFHENLHSGEFVLIESEEVDEENEEERL